MDVRSDGGDAPKLVLVVSLLGRSMPNSGTSVRPFGTSIR
jgi:hypothetical protein